MPLVHIALRQGRAPEFRAALGDLIHQAMVETINVPAQDRFQVITEHADTDLAFDPSYLGIARTPGVIFIQVTLNAGRSVELKKAFYQRVANDLSTRLGVRREDILISLVEVPKENWSFGNGVAQYA